MKKYRIKLLLSLLFAVILFHLLILVKIIPYDITWGGRLTNDSEMFVFETISILINVFLCWVLSMKGNLVRFKFSNRIMNSTLWIFFAIFILNTIGNIFAKTILEKFLAILTGLFALLLYKILVQQEIKNR